MNQAIREECYEAIRCCLRDKLVMFYTAHPEFINDARAQREIRESLESLQCIFEVLDKYTLIKVVE